MPNAVIYARFSSHTQTEQASRASCATATSSPAATGLSIVGDTSTRRSPGAMRTDLIFSA